MPGVIMEEIDKEEGLDLRENGGLISSKESLKVVNDDNPALNMERNGSEIVENDCVVEPTIEQLYHNVCEMQSSEPSPSRVSFGSYGEESRIDSELGHLVGGDMREVEIMEEEEEEREEVHEVKNDEGSDVESDSKKKTTDEEIQSENTKTSSSHSKKDGSQSQLDLDASAVSSPKGRKPPMDKKDMKSGNSIKKPNNLAVRGPKLANGKENPSDSVLENPDLGPFLLKQARDLLSSRDNPKKALELALRAAKSFEKCSKGQTNLELVMCLHVTAAIYSCLGRYSDAIPVLERSIEIPVIEQGQDHALAKFSGYMQLGDTYSMLGQLEKSILAYTTGLEIQRVILGESDVRYAETCRYLAEAHVQALQLDEAQRLCEIALNIHRENGSPGSLEEVADRRLMGLICESKGDHETALEHLVLASMAMSANGQDTEVATIDSGIGDIYLSLNRFDEAIFAYEKALTALKSTKGENHPAVASVFVRLADLYNQTGKFKESKAYCENALQIFGKPTPGIAPEEIASGLTEISAIYESMNDIEQAYKLLQKALKIYDNAPGQQPTIAGIEAQIGVLQYMLGNHSESYESFKNAVTKLRASGEKKSAFFGIVLNQMGLVCVQHVAINEAVELFEESKAVLEQEYGPYHPDTLAVYSNLAGAYDALGRLDDAIEVLELVVGMREEKLGTANPDVDDEKKRLAELLKEAGRVRTRKAKSLEHLLDSNHRPTTQNDSVKI